MIVDANYVDDGALREQDQVPLDEFLADRDRAQLTGRGTPFFSGREKEVQTFREMANALSLGRQGNATLGVEGPPGAGKSALLSQFMEEMRTLPNTERESRRWLPVPINGARAECPSRIAQAVDEAIAKRLAEDCSKAAAPAAKEAAMKALSAFVGKEGLRKVANDLGKLVRIASDRGFTAAGVQLGGARPDEDIEAVAARRAAFWRDWQIVLLIDEAQKISDTVPDAVPGTLSSIHQGLAGAPISFCAFGLPGTWGALTESGVSRTSVAYDLLLTGLEAGESRMAVRRCFEWFGVRDADAWEEAVVARSGNWPQHLSVYLIGTLTLLKPGAEAGNAIGSVQGTSLDDALALGDKGREAFYARRMQGLREESASFERYALELAAMLHRASGQVESLDVTHHLMSGLGLSDDTATQFRRAAQRSGLLSISQDSTCSIPIPSFAGYLLGESLPGLPKQKPPAE